MEIEVSEPVRLPRWSHETKPYWDALTRGKLMYQQCLACDEVVFHPRAICPYCLETELRWRESEGLGEIYSFTVQYKAPVPERQKDMPICLGIVAIKEGFHIFTQFVSVEPEALRIGLEVRVVFERVADELVLAKFAPTIRSPTLTEGSLA